MKRCALLKLLAVLFLFQSAWSQVTTAEKQFAMALTGDAIITRKLSVYKEPEFLDMIELIRSADVAFTNLEMLFHDYEPYPMHSSGGTYMRAEPALVKELVWAGFDMVARANNHTGDYGVLGMRLTTKYVREAGLVQAGVGESLPEAREAKFLETARGRVALISCASTYPDFCRAGKTRGDMPARPGLSPLRFSTTYTATREQLDRMNAFLEEFDMRSRPNAESLSFFGRRYTLGERFGSRTEPNEEDMRELAAVVRNASGLADYVIVTFHAHESGASRSKPADFLITFARAMIDAGADVVTGHGPHVLRGIEMYKGKPIFYSLGDFMFENETLLRLPQENYEPYDLGQEAGVADFNDARYRNDTRGFPTNPQNWEAVIALPLWRGDELESIELYPITLGYGESRTVRGRPMLADRTLGEKIINDLREASEPFGTDIEFRDGIGVVLLH